MRETDEGYRRRIADTQGMTAPRTASERGTSDASQDELERWIVTTLVNDEASTDSELIKHFQQGDEIPYEALKHGLTFKLKSFKPAPNKAQHSPLPWRFDKPNCIVAALSTKTKYSTVKIADVYETQFDLSEPETLDANAALIVRAVNHADKLAEALRDSLNGIDILEARQTLKAYDEAAQ